MKKLRKLFGKPDDKHIIDLMKLIESQSKETIAKWCLDYAENEILPIFKKHCPDDHRPKMALDASRDWFKGLKKFKEVQKIILHECHQAARELEDNPVAQAAARTIGQASACFHTPTHSLGLAFYGGAVFAYERVGLNATLEEYENIAREEVLKMTEALQDIAVENEPDKVKINWNCNG
jgi:hypothetical protein